MEHVCSFEINWSSDQFLKTFLTWCSCSWRFNYCKGVYTLGKHVHVLFV